MWLLFEFYLSTDIDNIILILVHDLVKLLFEFIHHCDFTFLAFLFLTPGGAKPKQKSENNFSSLQTAVQKIILALCGAAPVR